MYMQAVLPGLLTATLCVTISGLVQAMHTQWQSVG